MDRLTLQVQQTARMDFKLTVGSINEKVTVAASADVLQTENATVGTVIDSAKIVQLPLNGRNFIQLAQLVPGVQPGTPGSITVRRGRGSVGQTDAAFGSTAASANGQRDTADRFFLDGIETMDYDAVTYSFSPSIDSISEFKVETSTYSAESGSAPGAQVNMITKSGANALTGTLWEFNRNDALTQSYDAIANKSVQPARLNRNQFGANIGGPVVLPKIYHGKDKTFFFFNWESGYAAQGATPTPLTIPPAAIRTGDFSQLVNAKTKAPIAVLDPFSGQPFANNIIPTSRLSPQSLAFLQFVPQPNLNATAVNNYLPPRFTALPYQRNYTARIDHTLSSRDTLSGTYLFNDTYEASIPIWGHDERNNLGRTQNAQANEVHTFTPALINSVRFGWHTFDESEVFGTTNDPAYDVTGKMNLPGVSRLPLEYGPPTVTINGPDGLFSVYNLQRQIGPRTRGNSIYQLLDTVSWQRGTHFLKFGMELNRRNVLFSQSRAPRGAFTFDGTYTGSALADFMLGYVKSDNLNPTHTNTNLTDITQAYYVNDDWKTTDRLTINLGLRWDYFAPYTQSDDKFANIYQNGFLLGNVYTPANSPYGRGLLQRNLKDFGPRFGFAYRPRALGRFRRARRLRHLLHIRDFECYLRDGGRCTGHSGRKRYRQFERPPQHLFQRSLRCGYKQRRPAVRGQQRSELEGQLHSAVEFQHTEEAARQDRPRCWLRRVEGNSSDRHLSGPEHASDVSGSTDSRSRLSCFAPSGPAFSAGRHGRQIRRQFDLPCAAGERRTPAGTRIYLSCVVHLCQIHLGTIGHWRSGWRRFLYRHSPESL